MSEFESKSPGMDLFIMSKLLSDPNANFQKAKDLWENAPRNVKSDYEKEAKANLKRFRKYKTKEEDEEIKEDQYLHHTNPYTPRKRR